MSVAGVDVSTRQVAIVLLDDDSNQAETHTFPLLADGGDRPAWTAARSVQDVLPRPSGMFWDPVWLVGIEDPMGRWNMGTAKALGIILGAVLNNVPRDRPVLPMPPTEWKRETCGVPMAKKPEVAEWVFRTWQNVPALTDQDTLDAFAIAYAARAINSRAVAAAR